uniref:Uncharacterized protein n=1 Tax=Anopheles minimus TaxID=112268 RepID=A0A182WQF1_9DIPT
GIAFYSFSFHKKGYTDTTSTHLSEKETREWSAVKCVRLGFPFCSVRDHFRARIRWPSRLQTWPKLVQQLTYSKEVSSLPYALGPFRSRTAHGCCAVQAQTQGLPRLNGGVERERFFFSSPP